MEKEEMKELQETGENGDGDGEVWAENEMSTRCKGQQTWLWMAEDENEDNTIVCGVKREGGVHKAGVAQLPAVSL